MSNSKVGRSAEQVQLDILKLDLDVAKRKYTKSEVISVAKQVMKVKSNSIRDNIAGPFGPSNLILKFDKDGIATVPEHERRALAVIMRARPGRFTILPSAEPKAPKVVEPVEVEVSAGSIPSLASYSAEPAADVPEPEVEPVVEAAPEPLADLMSEEAPVEADKPVAKESSKKNKSKKSKKASK